MKRVSRRQFLIKAGSVGAGTLALGSLAGTNFSTRLAPIPLLIDADTANEVDDLYAIAIALLLPEFDIRGLTSAQYHTQERAPRDSVGASQKLNEDILSLMGKTGVPHPVGSNHPIVNKQRPQPSEAAEFMIEQALAMPAGEKLQVAILGAATNLASAVLMEPGIIPKVTANFLGFRHHPETGTWDKREFNAWNDPNAVNLLIDTPGLDFHVMTASTSQYLVFDKVEADRHLKDKGGIGDYLVNRWENFDRFWQETDKEKAHWIMWDVALIMALAFPELATQVQVQSPYDNRDRLMYAYTHIDHTAMKARYWQRFDAYWG